MEQHCHFGPKPPNMPNMSGEKRLEAPGSINIMEIQKNLKKTQRAFAGHGSTPWSSLISQLWRRQVWFWNALMVWIGSCKTPRSSETDWISQRISGIGMFTGWVSDIFRWLQIPFSCPNFDGFHDLLWGLMPHFSTLSRMPCRWLWLSPTSFGWAFAGCEDLVEPSVDCYCALSGDSMQ